jgi:colanic acid/amylovoran biosynthesis glycosyltransferase
MILPVCAAFRQRIVAEGCDEGKIEVHPSGIHVDRFPFEERSRRDGDATEILTVARLVEKKGVVYGLRAIRRLRDSGRRVRYSVVGDGPLRSELEEVVEDLDLMGEVRFLGSKSHEQVVRLMRDCHILIAPSVTGTDGDQEGIPNSLKEGMAAGMPVVGTHHSGIPELIEEGESGFLVPEADEATLASRLAWLIDHPERWPEMGRKGRARIEADYDIQALNRRLVDLYRGLLSR